MTITLDDVLAAAGARKVALAPETSGYLALAIADATSRLPLHVEDAGILLTTEGTVVLPRRGEVVAPAEAARVLRDRLARLLRVASGSPMPGLTSAARPRSEVDVDGVVAAIEAALIPVNRAAGRRAIARLARETERVVASGVLRTRAVSEPARHEPASNEVAVAKPSADLDAAPSAPPTTAPAAAPEACAPAVAPAPTEMDATAAPSWVGNLDATPSPAESASPAFAGAEEEPAHEITDIGPTCVTVVDAPVALADDAVGDGPMTVVDAPVAPIEEPIPSAYVAPVDDIAAPTADAAIAQPTVAEIAAADASAPEAIAPTDDVAAPAETAPAAADSAEAPAEPASAATAPEASEPVSDAAAAAPAPVAEARDVGSPRASVRPQAKPSSMPPPPSARVEITPTLMGVGAVGVQLATALLAELDAEDAAEGEGVAASDEAPCVASEPAREANEDADEAAVAAVPIVAVSQEADEGAEASAAAATDDEQLVLEANEAIDDDVEATAIASDDEPIVAASDATASDDGPVIEASDATASEVDEVLSGFPPGVDPHEALTAMPGGVAEVHDAPTVVPGAVEAAPEPAPMDPIDAVAASLRARAKTNAAAKPAPKPAPQRVVADLAPAQTSDVDDLLARFAVTQARDPSRIARSLKTFVGIEATAAPPVVWESPPPATAEAAPAAAHLAWEPEPMTPTPPRVQRARRKGLALSAALLAIGIVATGALLRYRFDLLSWSDAPEARTPAAAAPASPPTRAPDRAR